MNPLDNQNEINTNAFPNNNPQINPEAPNDDYLQQVNDPGLYHLMKQVKERQEGRSYKDVMPDIKTEEEKKEEEERLQKEKEEKENEELLKKEEEELKNKLEEEEKPGTIHNEFKNLFNKNVISNNRTRKCLLLFIIISIVIYCCIWEFLCMYYNVCYGESVHMKEWISHFICPFLFLLIIISTILFFSINYLSKNWIKGMIIVHLLLIFTLIVFGVFTLIYGLKPKKIEEKFATLTSNSKNYYDNESNKLKKAYRQHMIITFIFFTIICVLMLIIIFTSCHFYFVLTQTVFDWRPPLRSRLHNDREQRIINYYLKYNEDFRKLYQAEHPNATNEDVPIQQNNLNNDDIQNQYEQISNKNEANEGIELPKVTNKNQDLNDRNNENIPLNQNNNNNNDNNNNNNNDNNNNDNNDNGNLNTELPVPTLQPKRRRLPPMKKNDDE